MTTGVKNSGVPALTVTSVSKSFDGVAALTSCDLVVSQGSVTGLVGPNGAGKSTLLNVMSGLIRPDAGSLALFGRDVTGRPPRAMARAGLVRTFQLSRELSGLTALENVMLALTSPRLEGVRACFAGPVQFARQERERAETAFALLKRVGLDAKADELAGRLSGGQKKLLELTRALALKPRIILLDEPTAGVNPTLRHCIADIIRDINAQGVTFALVEHDMGFVARLCDEVVVLAEGRNLLRGQYADVMADKAVLSAYLGAVA
jgi:ABC-type branched-subunit amino acid transport system ATPase component